MMNLYETHVGSPQESIRCLPSCAHTKKIFSSGRDCNARNSAQLTTIVHSYATLQSCHEVHHLRKQRSYLGSMQIIQSLHHRILAFKPHHISFSHRQATITTADMNPTTASIISGRDTRR